MKIIVVLMCLMFSFGLGKVHAATNLPITGSFVMVDTSLSADAYEAYVKEMKTTGIDTLIIMASGSVDKQNGSYVITNYLKDTNNPLKNILRFANDNGMDVYMGLAGYDFNVVNHWVGRVDDPNTDKGILISTSRNLIMDIKEVLSEIGMPWSRMKGFYLGETGPKNLAGPKVNELVFFKELAEMAKAIAPDKKILISPYVLQENTYKEMKAVYENVYRETKIDIIAPQDSMGSLKVTTAEKSAELFRALKDATANFPGREAWANIETQLQPSLTDGDYNPSTIERVVSQIEAARPYVTKTITWIYQHTMLSVPAFDNAYSWSKQYTPVKAVARKKLREDYLKHYNFGCDTKYFYVKGGSQCSPTSSTYNLDGFECNKTENVSCESNLAKYVPDSTGKCFSDLDQCKNENGLRPVCERKYYFNKVNNQCLITSGTYNMEGFECNKTENVSCESNLAKYVPDSTGKCFSDLEQCKRENVLPVTNIPGDFNGDKVVNLVDFGVWKGKYAKGEFSLVEFTIWKKAYLGK